MARLSKPLKDWSDDDDSDGFPGIFEMTHKRRKPSNQDASSVQLKTNELPKTEKVARPPTSVRRRRLGPLSDNLLLRAWTPESAEQENSPCREKENTEVRRTRVELRTRKTKSTALSIAHRFEDENHASAQDDFKVAEDVSSLEDTFHSCLSEGSEFSDSDTDSDSGKENNHHRAPISSIMRRKGKPPKLDERKSPKRATQLTKAREKSAAAVKEMKAGEDVADTLSRLRLDDIGGLLPAGREVTPPSSPTKSRPGLVSPKKLPRIPATPHRPSSDIFWSREFVDEWNDEHSPRKQLFPDAAAAKKKRVNQSSPEKMSGKSVCGERVPGRGAEKKAFEKARQDLADKFLKELDAVITNGRLAELTAPTGGIRIFWSNKLNKTAGRAHWKCERVRSAVPGEDKVIHHASIELAEKIIDDEHRLLNTLAHEFCHLANYMISGITTNPHGQEFKAWGEKCSQAFGNRGVVVTTKHSYDIAFKFVWECVGCGIEYKRHSKSVDPARHRCSQCQSELKQTKPVPRRKKEDGSPAKQSEWQIFMKEQMPLIRAENPKMPLKDIMRIVAARWAERSKVPTPVPDESADEASEGWEDDKLVMLDRQLVRVDLAED